jgi:hypothetical protein
MRSWPKVLSRCFHGWIEKSNQNPKTGSRSPGRDSKENFRNTIQKLSETIFEQGISQNAAFFTDPAFQISMLK